MKFSELLPKMLGKDYGFYVFVNDKYIEFYSCADDFYEKPYSKAYAEKEVEFIGIKEGRMCVCIKDKESELYL